MEISGVEIVPVKLVITLPYERLAGNNLELREIIVIVVTTNYGLHIMVTEDIVIAVKLVLE